jgi:hypothetical protein
MEAATDQRAVWPPAACSAVDRDCFPLCSPTAFVFSAAPLNLILSYARRARQESTVERAGTQLVMWSRCLTPWLLARESTSSKLEISKSEKPASGLPSNPQSGGMLRMNLFMNSPYPYEGGQLI